MTHPYSAKAIQPLSEDDKSEAVIGDAYKRLAAVQLITAIALLVLIAVLIATRFIK
jgi:hypothetical protein